MLGPGWLSQAKTSAIILARELASSAKSSGTLDAMTCKLSLPSRHDQVQCCVKQQRAEHITLADPAIDIEGPLSTKCARLTAV